MLHYFLYDSYSFFVAIEIFSLSKSFFLRFSNFFISNLQSVPLNVDFLRSMDYLIFLLSFTFITSQKITSPLSHVHIKITAKVSGRLNYLLPNHSSLTFFEFSLNGMFIITFFRYMGFPLVDQPSTDISRYFYIASKFIENGINSGGEN